MYNKQDYHQVSLLTALDSLFDSQYAYLIDVLQVSIDRLYLYEETSLIVDSYTHKHNLVEDHRYNPVSLNYADLSSSAFFNCKHAFSTVLLGHARLNLSKPVPSSPNT